MNKFLNFSTILFSYVLITVLVISCGGSSGGSGGNGGNGGNGGGSVPQPEPKDTTCLLADRDDKDSWVAILCYDGVVIGKIELRSIDERQNVNFLIPSIESTAGSSTTRAWDLSKAREIHISHVKDYTPTFANAADGSIEKMITATEPDAAAYLLHLLTINSDSFLNASKDRLRTIGITFSPTSGSAINVSISPVSISPKLAVKSQDDFISMGRFAVPPLGELQHPLSYVLANDLDLVAPGEEGAKFNDSIIPVVDASFDFDGYGHTISLNSEIDAVAANKPAAIIGEIEQGNEFKNFTLDVNQPISGAHAVGTIVGYITNNSDVKIQNINININSNLTVYRNSVQSYVVGRVGGVAGIGCFDINNVVVKTADNASIRSAAKDYGDSFSTNVGGLFGYSSCNGIESINNSVADVTLGVYAAGDTAPNYSVSIGGLASSMLFSSYIKDNIVNLKIYRDEKLPANFAFDKVAGLVEEATYLKVVTNNLVYVDFSNLGQVKNVGGLFNAFHNNNPSIKISNNMIFIADDFDDSTVTEKFGAAITEITNSNPISNFIDNFFSTPVTDAQYNTNPKLASFVHTAEVDINFNNLILDNTLSTVMFKAGNEAGNLQGKVGGANGAPLYTLAEAKTNEISTLFSDGNTSWEAVSGGYPQLKAPSNLTGFLTIAEIFQAWNATNADIQAGLTARAASQQ